MTRIPPMATIALLVAAIGAPAAGADAPENAGGTKPTPALTASAGNLGDESLRILDRGAPPRRALRWTLTPGQHELHRSVVISETITSIDGEEIEPGSEPVLITDAELFVDEVADDGQITIGFLFPSPPDAPAPWVTTGRYRMDDRGRILGVAIDPLISRAGDDASAVRRLDSAAIEREIRRMQLTLPPQEVGVGARWTMTTEVVIGGQAHPQVVTYTVESMDADRVNLLYESKVLSNEARGVRMQGLPEGARAEVRNTLQSASGRHELSLRRIGPVRIKSQSELVQLFRVVDERDGGDAYDVLNHVFGVFAANSIPADEPALATAIEDDGSD